MNQTVPERRIKKQPIIIGSILLVILLAVTGITLWQCRGGRKDPGIVPRSGYFSPISMDAGKDGSIYIADETAYRLSCFSEEGELLFSYDANAPLRKVLYNEGTVYALAGGLDGQLLVLDEALKLKCSIPVGHTPSDLVISGDTAYAANRFSGTVSVVSLSEKKELSTIEAGREPVVMAMAAGKLYVADLLPDETMDKDCVASTVYVIDPAAGKVEKEISLTNGSQSVRGICVSPDEKTVYITHLLSRYSFPTSQLDRGWINTNAFTVLDTESGENYAVLLDSVEKGAGNPWDVEISNDGATLYFSISGTGEIETVNVKKLKNAEQRVRNGHDEDIPTLSRVCDDVSFLSSIAVRYSLAVQGLRDILLLPGESEKSAPTVLAAAYFDGTILSFDGSTFEKKKEFRVGEQPENDSVRLGEMLWYDASNCYQSWESCASCHPDARADALNWDNLNDGLGNPKNTATMVYSYRCAPVMATGARASGELATRRGMLYIQYNVLEEEQLTAIDDYLRSLLPEQSPYLERDGSYSEAALRGKELFESAGCAVCHPAPIYSDLTAHESPFAGGDATWEQRKIYTPSLVEVWRTAPYSYTGRVGSVLDVIKAFAPDLSPEDAADLEAFVLSIGIVGEDYGVVETFLQDPTGETVYDALRPDSTLTSLTVMKQAAAAPDAAVKAALLSSSGDVIAEKEQQLTDVKYRQIIEIPLGFETGSLEKGARLRVEILDGKGNALATPYVLQYND